MKKRMVGLCVIGLIGGAMGTQVAAAVEQEKASIVTYDGTSGIPDPDHPFDPAYIVNVPGNVTFSDNSKVFNGEIDMLAIDEDGKTSAYSGDGVADVYVKSDNKLQLKRETGDDPVDYDYLFASTAGINAKVDSKLDQTTSDTYNKLFQIDKSNSSYKVRYKMKGNATKKGAHMDTLTYKVTSVTSATN